MTMGCRKIKTNLGYSIKIILRYFDFLLFFPLKIIILETPTVLDISI